MTPAAPPLERPPSASTMSSTITVVPPCPARLSFSRDDFLTNFVNLSSNLVGLEESMARIEEPLCRYSDRAKEVRRLLEEAVATLKAKLVEKESLQAKRVALQNLEHVVNTLNKIERLLGLGVEEAPQEELSGDLVERVAADVNYLNFCVSKCSAPAFVEEIRPRIQVIGDRLQGALETQLLDSVGQDNRDALRRCLRIYATIDKVADAQELVRRRIVSPYLDDVITEQSLNEDPQGLKGLLQRVNKIIPTKLDLLVQLTQLQSGVLRDFDFLVQSLWVEIVEKFEENMAFVFSAGEPEKFHSNFTTAYAWLDDFEKRLGDIKAVEKFRQHPSYTTFVSRWNLSIYFQIRHQEIAMPVELAVENMFERGSGIKFLLVSTDAVLASMRQCWDPSIFLPPLTHRFWKMTLQILARYTKAASKAITQNAAEPSTAFLHDTRIKPSATTLTLNPGPPQINAPSRMTHSRSASDQGNIGAQVLHGSSHSERPVEGLSEDELINGIVCLYMDIAALSKEHPYIVNELVLPSLAPSMADHVHLLNSSLDEGFEALNKLVNPLVARIVDIISGRCLPHLKQVSDIPRLYRRTNRELPSKACTYMTSMVAPIQTFFSIYSPVVIDSDVINAWLVQMFVRICDQYLINVSDVLAAVQKMEESLQRLKKVRGGASSNPGTETRAGGMSDDDKIRLQLYVDVQHLITSMRNVGVQTYQVPSAVEVDKLVKEATKSCFDDYIAKMPKT